MGSDTWLASRLPCVSSSAAMAGSRTPQLATEAVMRMLFTVGVSHRKCSLAQKPSGSSAACRQARQARQAAVALHEDR